MAKGKKKKKNRRHAGQVASASRATNAPQAGSKKQGQRTSYNGRQPRGVPPIDAFDNVKRRKAPNLPGQPDYVPPSAPLSGPLEEDALSQNAGRGTGNARRQSTKGKGGQAPRKGQPVKTAKPRKPKKAKRPVSPARRRRRRRMVAFLLVLALIVGGVGFSFGVLFKIDTFTIEGETRYTLDELVAAFGGEEGDNMFSFSAGGVAQSMTETLPYLESIKIARKLPSTIEFRVVEAQERYCIIWGEGYAVLSPSRKVLRIAEEAPEGLTMLYGLSDIQVEPGFAIALLPADEEIGYDLLQELPQPVQYVEPEPIVEEPPPDEEGEGENAEGEPEGGEGEPQNEEPQQQEPMENETDPTEGEADGEGAEGEGEAGEAEEAEPEPEPEPEPVVLELQLPNERLAAMDELLLALEESGLTNITWVNVTDTLDLQFRWENRITVVLGARSGLDKKLQFAVVTLTDDTQSNITSSDRGTLDVSTYITTLDGAFRPD